MNRNAIQSRLNTPSMLLGSTLHSIYGLNVFNANQPFLNLNKQKFDYDFVILRDVDSKLANKFRIENKILNQSILHHQINTILKSTDRYNLKKDDLNEIQSELDKVLASTKLHSIQAVPFVDALKMFRHNPFQLLYLSYLKEQSNIHIVNYGSYNQPLIISNHETLNGASLNEIRFNEKIHSIKLTATDCAVYSQVISNKETISRIHGISFETNQESKAYTLKNEELEKRDHRVIGTKQKLFHMHSLSPGSPFLLPHGIILLLSKLIRSKYHQE